MTDIIADKGWNLDTIIAYIAEHGASIEEDNYGQIVIYTELAEDDEGRLIVLPPDIG